MTLGFCGTNICALKEGYVMRPRMRVSDYGISVCLRFIRAVTISEDKIPIPDAETLKLVASCDFPTNVNCRTSFVDLPMLSENLFLISHQVEESLTEGQLGVKIAVYKSSADLAALSEVANITVPYGRSTDTLASEGAILGPDGRIGIYGDGGCSPYRPGRLRESLKQFLSS